MSKFIPLDFPIKFNSRTYNQQFKNRTAIIMSMSYVITGSPGTGITLSIGKMLAEKLRLEIA